MWWLFSIGCALSEAADPVARFDGADAARPHLAARLTPVARGLSQPTELVFAPGAPTKLVVAQKEGAVVVVDLPTGTVTPWFSVPVRTDSEMGLLGLAFAPDWATSGRFYVHTNPAGTMRSRLASYVAAVGAPGSSAPREERVLLEVEQPYVNHDGGPVVFGADGRLYWALGDGGSHDDPKDAGQRLDTLLGKLLRIEPTPTAASPYAVPADNPFVGRPGARGEIWVYGLRNPWKIFPLADGRFIVADVGQNQWEEVDVLGRGDNAGWRRREGRHCHDKAACEGTFVEPIYEYSHEEGVSITGGVIPSRPASLAGRYVFGDFGTGRLWALTLPKGEVSALGGFAIQPSSFGLGPDGAAYVADFGGGVVYRID